MVRAICYVQPGTGEWVSALLMDAGFDGIEEQGDALVAYLSGDSLPDSLKQELERLSKDHRFSYDLESLPDTDWNAIWESSFHPVEVNGWCRVRATFHQPDPKFEIELVINPKMSFGTGHHATTYLMMARMKDLMFPGKSVLDMGCGSGILAILADRLGATHVDAIDNEEWAFANTEENLQLNNCQRVHAYLGSWEAIPPTAYDIILANINRNTLLEGMTELVKHLKENGHLLLSGILAKDRPVLEQAIHGTGMRVTEVTERESWLCMAAVKSTNT